MSTFQEIYQGVEKTFWNSLTKKLFSFLLLFAVNLGYLYIWRDRREAVEAALAGGTVAAETLASVAAVFDAVLPKPVDLGETVELTFAGIDNANE